MTDDQRRMQAKAAELAAMVKAHHLTYTGAENSIAGYSEGLAGDKAAAWKLYDYGIEQFRAFHSGAKSIPAQDSRK